MPTDRSKHTPMMQQYLNIKDEYPDAFLFYRLGDFYELFFDDAKEVAQILELTLTSRNKKSDIDVPMCGVPHHAAQDYIHTLIEKGHRVAICEQMESAQVAKGMVRREVVQVITPGTVMDGMTVASKENNFIASVMAADNQWTLAYADLSTGEINITTMDTVDSLLGEIGQLGIKEIVFLASDTSDLPHTLKKRYGSVISVVDAIQPSSEFDPLKTQLHESYEIDTLDLLLTYLMQTQMRRLDHLQIANVYHTEQFLMYGQEVQRNLELMASLKDGTRKGTLLWLLDETKTAMGGRLLKQWISKPLITLTHIEDRQCMIETLIAHFFERVELVELLKHVYDLERLTGRIAYGSANAKDLIQLRDSLLQIPTLRQTMTKMNDTGVWDTLVCKLDDVEEVAELISQAIVDDPPISITDGNIIRPGFHETLDTYIDAMSNGKQWMAELQAREREQTGIRNLKIGFNKIFGYYIEVTKSHIDKIDDSRYIRKQTLANSERYVTSDIKEKERIILEAEEKSQLLEHDLFLQVRERIKHYTSRLQSLAKVVAQIDVLQSFAYISDRYNYVKPTYHDTGQAILIEAGRHPVVEKVMDAQTFVPNDVDMSEQSNILLITGPNMSGKSTYMRQLALIVIMGQMGCFVPATNATLPIFDKIFTRIGAMDDLFGGQSTFMVEMSETNHALQQATERSLLLFDEIGRGTATYDGMALAEAIIEYVHNTIRAKTLFSTHYHELTKLSSRLDQLTNVHVGAVEEQGKLIFLHQLKEGPSDKSYGVQVAQLAELPQSVLSRATAILQTLETRHTNTIENDQVHETMEATAQLSLFGSQHAHASTKDIEALEVLRDIDITAITPLEAFDTLRALTEILAHQKGEHT